MTMPDDRATEPSAEAMAEAEALFPGSGAGFWQHVALRLDAFAVQRERERHQWQPIETAPKDETPIFVLSKEYTDGDGYHHPAKCSIAKWWAEGTSWTDQYGSTEAEDVCTLTKTGIWSSGGGWFQPNEVTHWQPLPEPPEDKP